MTDIEILKEGIKALDSKKADDIRILKVRDLTILANYFVIVSGSSSTQVKALADEVDFKLGEKGEEPKSIDGKASGNWIVLDYIDVVFHVFYKETRDFYDLERLWLQEFLRNFQKCIDKVGAILYNTSIHLYKICMSYNLCHLAKGGI